MKVFVISMGCRYEGGIVKAVYASEESGRKAALELVASHNQELDSFRIAEAAEQETYWANHDNMSEKERNYWSDGHDFIMIEEMDLLG